MHRLDIADLGQLVDDRHEDDDRWHRVDEIADHDEEEHQQEHDHLGIGSRISRDELGDRVGAAQVGEHPAEGGRRRHQGERQRIEHAGVDEIARELAEMAGPHGRNDHRDDVDGCDHAGLGRRKPAGQDAPHDDDGDHHRQRRAAGRDEYFDQRGALLENAGRAEEVAVDHQPDADHDARHHAGEKQPADRHVAGGAIDDRHDRGRNEVRDRRGRGDQCRRERAVVALLVHLGRDGAAEHGDVRRRGPGNSREEHAEQGDHLREAAAQVPDQRLCQADQALGHVG